MTITFEGNYFLKAGEHYWPGVRLDAESTRGIVVVNNSIDNPEE